MCHPKDIQDKIRPNASVPSRGSQRYPGQHGLSGSLNSVKVCVCESTINEEVG